MDKKIDKFLFILGIIFTFLTAILQIFINIHLYNLKKYIYFAFYFIIFIYWLKDKNFKFKYFLIYTLISFYFNFSLTTPFSVVFTRTFLEFFSISDLSRNILLTLVIGTTNTIITSFIYQFLKIKSHSNNP
ncbi:hypothetical protein C4N20_00490 [Fusobacterium ulcerans]|uniref:Uncharacterized protein n=1 Tax=Fusobacterium ulcerans TaxID=861 RepID=A0AAX2JBD2_9FUSO|nr:hypothetical protein C4N20_00490 [Fusobacterium ulcerans]EJZ44609.1 hypothetical protein FUAG_03232 [Fusobacterium ulcerans ATCC 49185]SQJ06293.1 Uncharacterised protein [Fusobacterium ulcerans]